MRKLSFLLSAIMVITFLGSAVFAGNKVTDTLTRETTGVDSGSSTYTEWSGKKSISDAVYAGQSAGGGNSIQIRSKNSNSGIITTGTAGYARTVTVKWNTNNTTRGRTLNVYGKNTAYLSPEQLYSSESGELIGTIVLGDSDTGSLSIEDDYSFIGLCSNDGAIYLNEIDVEWETDSSTNYYDITFSSGSVQKTIQVKEGSYNLPANMFDIPEGKLFAGWRIGDKDYKEGDGIDVKDNLTVNAIWADKPVIEGVTDTITAAMTGVHGTSYTLWEDKQDYSDAVYSGISASDHNAIQLNTKKDCGIVTTSSGGRILMVRIEWSSYSEQHTERTLEIYGKNTEYDHPYDLYNDDTKGTLLGVITNKAEPELIINGDYQYVGIRTGNNAVYLDSVEFVWDDTYPHEPINKCKITFNPGEGGGYMLPAYVRPGTEYELPGGDFVNLEGKVFDGWIIGDTGTVLYEGQKIAITEDTSLTAVYTEVIDQPDINEDGAMLLFENGNPGYYLKFGNLPQGTVAYRVVNLGYGVEYYISMDESVLNSYRFGRNRHEGTEKFYISLPEGYSLDGASGTVTRVDKKIPSISSSDSSILFSLDSNGNYTRLSSLPEKTFAYCVSFASSGTITVTAQSNIAAALEGNSLSLDGDIGINFYMSLSDDVRESLNAYMLFTTSSGTSKVYVRDVKNSPRTVNGKTYYVFNCGTPAKEMNRNVTAQMYINGNKLGDEMVFSVRDYAEYLIAHQNEEQFKNAAPVAIAMLNYGAAAQNYFGADTSDLANKDLAASDQIVPEVNASIINRPFAGSSNLPAGVGFAGASLALNSETTLSLYFTSDKELEFSCPGCDVQTSSYGDYQIARIRNINIKDLDTNFTVTVSYGVKEGTVTYNPLTYCYNVLNGASDKTDLQNVCKALFVFYIMSVEYDEIIHQ